MKTKGKTKLEDLEVKKIDAVDIGADQKANILIKKRGGAEEPKGNFFKRFFNAFCDSLGVNSEDVRKSMEDEATSFDDVMNEKKIYDVRDQIWNACNSLEQSIVSILLDKECEDKQAAIAQSIDQFKAFSDDASKSWIKLERAATDKEDTVVADDFEIAKMQEVIEKSCDPETINKEKEEKENEMAFDISNMTEEEKKEALKALQADASKESTEKRFNSGAGEDQGTNVKPANFLDIGGGASAEVMCGSLEIVLSDPQVESVLINVYGGITSCEQVAKGILEALDKLGSSKPLVVRFDGNAAAEGLHILAQADRVNLHVAQTMEEAAQQAARLAANGKEVR